MCNALSVCSFVKVGEDFDIVVNCTGLGAKQLTGDFLLTPVRGQAMKVRLPLLCIQHII